MKKREIIWRSVMSFLWGSALVTGNLFCLITAFNVPVDGKELIFLCVLAVLFCSVIFIFKRSWIGSAVFWLFLAVLVYWRFELIRDGFLIAFKIIAQKFMESYNTFRGLQLIVNVSDDASATYFMAVLGGMLGYLTVRTVAKGGRLWGVAIFSILLLVPCLLIINSMPDMLPFVVLMGAYGMLLLTQSQRWHDMEGRYSLMAMLTVPVVIFSLALAAFISPTEHQRPVWAENIRTHFRETFSQPMAQQDPVTGETVYMSPFLQDTLGKMSWNSDISETDLDKIGPQIQTGGAVMSVLSDDGGTIYLKGNTLGVYQDNRWSMVEESEYAGLNINSDLWTTNNAARHEVMVRTYGKSSIFYLPYVPNNLPIGAEIYYDAFVKNSEGLFEYAVAFVEGADNARLSDGYEEFVHETYTQVPEETRQVLSGILEELSGNVSEITDYVRNSAAYSLETGRVPEGEEFTEWFLTESDTGYCVHFATAATVLLRCFDIPARYVNGYLVQAEAGDWVTVTQDDAHAWVEYYVDGYGWIPLEVTPAASRETTTETEEQYLNEQEVPETEKENTGEIPPVEDEKSFAWIFWCIGFAAVLILWVPVVRKVRTSVLKKGTANRRTVKYYRHILLLSKRAKKPVLEEVETMAMKARFSQHDISEAELELVMRAYLDLVTELKNEKGVLSKVLYRFIFAL